MRSLAIIVALAFGTSGCAVLAAKEPGPVSVDRRPECNDGKGAVVADGLAAAALGVLTLALGAADEGGTAAVAGLSSLVYVGSAVAGSKSADRCRAAQSEYADRLAARELRNQFDRDAEREELAAAKAAAALRPATTSGTTSSATTSGTTSSGTSGTASSGTARPVPPTPTTTVHDDGGEDDPAPDDEGAADPVQWRDFWREVTP